MDAPASVSMLNSQVSAYCLDNTGQNEWFPKLCLVTGIGRASRNDARTVGEAGVTLTWALH
jgi:hypothetical protein